MSNDALVTHHECASKGCVNQARKYPTLLLPGGVRLSFDNLRFCRRCARRVGAEDLVSEDTEVRVNMMFQSKGLPTPDYGAARIIWKV